MKKISLLAALAVGILFITACGSSESASKKAESESAVSGEIHEAGLEVKGEFVTIAEKSLKENYHIDNFKIDMSSSTLKVFNSTDEKNAETGEEYKNVINGMAEYTYQDKIYNLNLMYSKTSKDSYKILFMDTNYDHELGIDIPLESD